MKQFQVTGMTCAACSARVEKAVSKVEGVRSCTVSLLTNSMRVDGEASSESIISAVVAAGYGASEKSGQKRSGSISSANEQLKDTETPILKRRLMVSLVFWLLHMYVSMGSMMWGWPIPSFFHHNHVAHGLLQLLLTVIIMVINQRFFINGFKSLWHRSPNMDALVALGSTAAFAYSTVALFAMSEAQRLGDAEMVMKYMDSLYFESASTILTLITLGKMLEARSKGRTTDALKSLMKLSPKNAVVVRDGIEQSVDIEEVSEGDIFLVRPGESIPVDGVVVSGDSAVDESALTGESIPVDKSAGEEVSAGTLNRSGFLQCRATRVGEDTTLSQIIKLVSDAAATKAPIAKLADKVSGVFVPTVMAISAVTIVVWCLLGKDFGYALARGIAVLVVSCPCALGLATPVAIMVGSGKGARSGILFKTAVSLEETGKVRTVVLDKTGTITRGEPTVTDIIPASDMTERELLELSYALENRSEHPLAGAVRSYCEALSMVPAEVSHFTALPGNGLSAKLDGTMLYGGNSRMIEEYAEISGEWHKKADSLAEDGKTPLFFARGDKLCGIIAVSDTMKEESFAAISELKKMGLRVVMLTGDNERTARAIGVKAGVDEVIAGVLPSGKEAEIRRLQQNGRVIMVGDGINDAPALTTADIGIAIGAGADVAIEAAEVVLMKSSLTDVSGAITLSRATLRIIKQNLFWAFIYNTIGIPLAAGVFVPIFGWSLNPMFAAAAMSLSSFCVVTNALRLNLVRLHKQALKKEQDIKNTIIEKETKTMVKTMKIEGMMCGHCEMHVKKALEALNGVTSAEVSHKEGTAVVTMDSEVSSEVLTKAVVEEGYKVISVQ